jgi:hypothetical protein
MQRIKGCRVDDMALRSSNPWMSVEIPSTFSLFPLQATSAVHRQGNITLNTVAPAILQLWTDSPGGQAG